MFSSRYSKILHDPECQNHCCLGSYVEPMSVNDVEMGQLPNAKASFLEESTFSPVICENKILYDVNTFNNQVPLFQVDNQIATDKFGIIYSITSDNKPTESARHGFYSSNVIQAEERSKQRSYFKEVAKRKRKRTVFTTEQIVVMEGVFKKRPYVSKEERLILTQQLNISEKAIKIWFQNRRRVTEKREKDQSDCCHSDSTGEELSDDYITKLDYIESHIKQNTDEYGYVTLSNKALSEIVKLIDSALSHNTHCHNTLYENKPNQSYIMYEPVSPESSSDDSKENDDILKWEPSKPEESLQRLVDIQSLMYS